MALGALSSRKELTAEARELKGELYCLPCHDKMGVPICGACRRPIEGRVVNALGKQWHVEVSRALVPGPLGHLSAQAAPWVLPRLGPQPISGSRETRAHSQAEKPTFAFPIMGSF